MSKSRIIHLLAVTTVAALTLGTTPTAKAMQISDCTAWCSQIADGFQPSSDAVCNERNYDIRREAEPCADGCCPAACGLPCLPDSVPGGNKPVKVPTCHCEQTAGACRTSCRVVACTAPCDNGSCGPCERHTTARVFIIRFNPHGTVAAGNRCCNNDTCCATCAKDCACECCKDGCKCGKGCCAEGKCQKCVCTKGCCEMPADGQCPKGCCGVSDQPQGMERALRDHQSQMQQMTDKIEILLQEIQALQQQVQNLHTQPQVFLPPPPMPYPYPPYYQSYPVNYFWSMPVSNMPPYGAPMPMPAPPAPPMPVTMPYPMPAPMTGTTAIAVPATATPISVWSGRPGPTPPAYVPTGAIQVEPMLPPPMPR